MLVARASSPTSRDRPAWQTGENDFLLRPSFFRILYTLPSGAIDKAAMDENYAWFKIGHFMLLTRCTELG